MRRFDSHGNEVEGSVSSTLNTSNTPSPLSTAKHQYEYDSHGNWTRHELQGSVGLLWTRAISYW